MVKSLNIVQPSREKGQYFYLLSNPSALVLLFISLSLANSGEDLFLC